ncbi:MAG: SRPBCC family protein [Gammaproteobacteria bacterium]
MTDLTVNLKKVIQASIEDVFDAWLNPETLSKFILPMPGMPEPQTQNEAYEGGSFSIIMHVGEDKIPHTGKYLEIRRPNKLVFTWESPFSTDNSTVTLNFTALDEDKTNVELTHIRFIDEENRTDHEGGWSNILDKLNEVMSLIKTM